MSKNQLHFLVSPNNRGCERNNKQMVFPDVKPLKPDNTQKNKTSYLVKAACFVALMVISFYSKATTLYWRGNGANVTTGAGTNAVFSGPNWNASASGTPTTAPTAADDLIMDMSAIAVVGITMPSATFTASSLTITWSGNSNNSLTYTFPTGSNFNITNAVNITNAKIAPTGGGLGFQDVYTGSGSAPNLTFGSLSVVMDGTMGANVTAFALLISGSVTINGATSVIINPGKTGPVTVSETSFASSIYTFKGPVTIDSKATQATFSGIVLRTYNTMNFQSSLNVGATNNGGTVVVNGLSAGARTLVYGGDVTFGPASSTTAVTTTCIQNMQFDGTGTQALNVNSANINVKNLTIGNTNMPTVTVASATSNNLNVASALTPNAITVAAGATLNLGTVSLNRDANTGTGTLTLNGLLQLAGANNFPANYSVYSLSPTSTVEYNLAGAQTVASVNYGNLTLSGSGVKTFASGSTGIAGNCTISGATGDATPNATTITYNGTGTQTMGGMAYYTLIANSTGPLNLSAGASVANTLTFTNGIINNTAAGSSNPIYFGNSATSTGASNASHVNGFVAKLGTGAFTYPIGNATNYSPIGTNLTANASGMTASYIVGAGGTIAYTTPLMSRNYQEYWDLTPVSTATGTVTVYWDGYNNPAITAVADLVVAHYTSAAWKSEGVAGAGTGTTAAGSVTSAAISTWSPFTLGSISTTTVLPVTLTSFTGTASGCTASLAWQSATETNSTYYAVEASKDGSSFTQVGKINSKNSTSGAAYSFGYALGSGTTYFRLKMVDVDGVFSYSGTVAVTGTGDCGVSLSVKVSPNPTSNMVNIQGLVSGSKISLLNISGQKMTEITANDTNHAISLSGYANGIYTVRVQKADGTVSNVKVVKN